MKMVKKIAQMSAVLFIVFLISHMVWSRADGFQNEGKKMYDASQLDTATVAGGCFWCVEAPFEKVDGVVEAISGYAGGDQKNPSYKEVSSGATKHAESVQIIYDPGVISYSQILDVFWKNIDPTDQGGSFYDRGSQYRSVIFYHDEEQKEIAQMSKKKIEELGVFDKPIVTEIARFTGFYRAEEYHQDFYKKNPSRYHEYRSGSGRDEFIKKVWGDFEERIQKFEKPAKETLKQTLTPLQFEVTQLEGTERAFENLYWDSKKEGIYVDIVSGEPLFSSTDKFKSGTGWPSYTKPLEPRNIIEKEDHQLMMKRTEVRSRIADSHLGHVFNDGPPPTRLRYCINSAALRFVPMENLEKEGYGEYLSLFK